jgi:hypothetical protein
MSYLTTIRRAQADSEPAAQAAAPSAEDVPTEVVQAVATQVVDQAALADQVDRLWAPRANTEDDPLAVLGQANGGGDANHGWGAIIAAMPTVAGAVKIEIAPPTPQAAVDMVILK